jgi:hypothetical protein
MRALLLAALGIAMIVMSAAQMVQGLRTGKVRVRGRRIVKRESHPVMFWLNFAGLTIVCSLGLASVLLAVRSLY